ncbi:65-kDa microtubule-associated protein 3-like isoform X2 [Cornus florida]|nr:65-kDa microtubule-associated protein 3-like isoform X2 [Cornus florida]
MYNYQNNQLLHTETPCGSLLSELQKIWDEVGELDAERDRMLFELEQQCLEVYRRKVDQASKCRAHLRQALADSNAELTYICSAMGERPVHIRQFEQSAGSLKKELEAIMPQLEEMRKRKSERRSQFVKVLDQIRSISKEIYRSTEDDLCTTVVDESDLSLKKLEELRSQLLALQKEKSDRLKQVLDLLNTLNSLCVVLGMDFKVTISEIHPNLDDSSGTNNISSDTIERLSNAICGLQELKLERMQRLQDLATTMVELWSLMDTPIEEQQMFQNITRNIVASENEITEPNLLSVDFLNTAEEEVLRLQQMKLSKIKEVLLKKRSNLEEICRKAHMVDEALNTMDVSVEAIESGAIDPSYLLELIELQISKVKEEAFNRKDILDKVEKWLAAREEECWLEEYNRDDNRYNAGRGTHLILKRAEKARALVNKIPAMVEALTSKAVAWKKERGVDFSYDGVRLLSLLEQYSNLKQEKEQERQRHRDNKKLQGQLMTEQEALFGSKPSPLNSGKKVSTTSTGCASNKRFSLGGAMLHNPNVGKSALRSRPITNVVALHYSSRNDHQCGSFASLSSGKKNLDVTGPPVKQHNVNASNALEIDSPSVRKPLSPVCSALSSKANAANMQDQNKSPNALQKAIPNNKMLVASPGKILSGVDENETPKKMPIPMPTTPSTVSSAMQTATTPATPFVHGGAEGIEYSYEERRAGFILA